MKLDIEKNRQITNWSMKTQVLRILWGIVYIFFRFTPRQLWPVRVFFLRCFGAKIGRRVHIFPNVRIVMPWNIIIGNDSSVGDHAILYALGRIVVGERSTISQGCHLCAGSHDISSPTRELIKGEISIGDDTWLAADAFVCPNVIIEKSTVIGARSVVTRSIPEGVFACGNPARVVRQLE